MDTSSPLNFDRLGDSDEATPDYERLWRLLQRTGEKRRASYDVDDEWTRLADRLDLDAADTAASAAENHTAAPRRAPDRGPRSSDASPGVRRQRWAQVLTVAALVLCLVGGGALWWSQSVSVTTAAGERTTVTLPDGSTVELNGTTTLQHPRTFASIPLMGSSTRTVQLEGEAFFSVVNGNRPFRVETSNARVEVLGTRFNVHTRPENKTSKTEIVVASGAVRVSAASAPPEASVTLNERGEASRVTGSTGRPSAPQPTSLKHVQAWRQGGFAVSDAALPTVLRELEHRFGTSLRLAPPVAETDTMTLHYARNARLEDVLRDICLLQNLTYRETSQGYELVRK